MGDNKPDGQLFCSPVVRVTAESRHVRDRCGGGSEPDLRLEPMADLNDFRHL
jgi:hypothetical protein